MTASGNGAVDKRPSSSASGGAEVEAMSGTRGDPAAAAACSAETDDATAPDGAAGSKPGEADGSDEWTSSPPSDRIVTGAIGEDWASIKSVRADLAGSSLDRELADEGSGAAGCGVSEGARSLRGNVGPERSVAPEGCPAASLGMATGERGVIVCGRDCRSDSLWSVVVTFDNRSIDVV